MEFDISASKSAAFSDKLRKISDPVRDGVIEKWITYSKSENLTEFMIWRVKVLSLKLSREENFILKFTLRENRDED